MLMELNLNASEVEQIIRDHVSKSVPNVSVGEIKFDVVNTMVGNQMEEYYVPKFKGVIAKVEL